MTLSSWHFPKVVDPYRWMEDADAPETKAFVDAQNRLTMPYIQSCPHREKLRETLKTMMDFPKIGCPFKRGERYFYFYNSGLQNQRYASCFVRQIHLWLMFDHK